MVAESEVERDRVEIGVASLLRVTSVCVAPSSKMPPPLVVTGVSSFALQSLLLKTRLCLMTPLISSDTTSAPLITG